MGKTDLIPFKIIVPTALHLPEITTQLALRIRPVDKSEYQRMKNEKNWHCNDGRTENYSPCCQNANVKAKKEANAAR